MKQGLVIGCVCLSVCMYVSLSVYLSVSLSVCHQKYWKILQTGHKLSQLYDSYIRSHNVNFAIRILFISLLGVSGPRLPNLSLSTLRMKLDYAHYAHV